jgi:hypothetical protein
MGDRSLVCGLVLAGRAAGLAVQESVGTQADVDDGLAEAAVFLALAAAFRLLALRAAVFGGTGSGAHKLNVAQESGGGNVTEVIEVFNRQSGINNQQSAIAFVVPYNSEQ